ncbi:MAG: O-antigen ligase family protein [Butyrivibrio sp.]|nr:O-antigen ligase family protein [Butyrivibrio sp.]
MNDISYTEKSIQESIKLTLWAYLFMMCCGLSFYTGGSYVGLSDNKFIFYKIVSVIGICILSVLYAILFFLKQKRNDKSFRLGHNYRETDIFLVFFVLSNIVTFIFSENKTESLWGTSGWQIGFLTWMIMLFYFYSFSGFMQWNKYLWYAIFLPVFAVMLIAVLNRFGFFLLYGVDSTTIFLSTIGNINWYCGYLSVFLPIGAALLMTNTLKMNQFLLLTIFITVGYVSAFTQGSESALLIIASILLVIGFVGLENRKMWITYLVQVFLCGLSSEISRHLVRFFGYAYEADNPCIKIVNSRIGLIVCAAAFLLISGSRLCESLNIKWKMLLYRTIYVIIVLCILAFGVFYLINNFDENWGNGRGFIWQYSIKLFQELDLKSKLIGVGQDGFADYSYSYREYLLILDERFGAARLTNAHSELFTIIINNGIIGAIAFIGLFVFTMKTLISSYKKDKNIFALVFLVSIITYCINNLVSFTQILSTPYIFMFMGIGVASVSNTDFNKNQV